MAANQHQIAKIISTLEIGLIIFVLGCTGHLRPMTDPNIHKVTFNFEGPAKSVCIVGDFNQWMPDAHCLDKRKGRWYIQLSLPHGPIHYAFIVDGKQWVVDPRALYVEDDGFGQLNSVVMVE